MRKQFAHHFIRIALFLFFCSLSCSYTYAGQVDEISFKDLFEHHGTVMLIIDPESGLIRDANQAALRFYGYDYGFMTQMNINQINILTADEIKREQEAAVVQARNYFVFKHQISGGEIKTVEVYSYPYRTNQGTTLLYSIVHDITDRERAMKEADTKQFIIELLLIVLVVVSIFFNIRITRTRNALVESNQRISSLFQNMNEGFALYELVLADDGSITHCKILTTNQAFDSIVAHEAEANVDCMKWLSKALYDEQALNEIYYATVQKKYYSIHAYKPQVNQVVLLFNDVTREMDANIDLSKEKEYFRTTLLSVGDGVITTDTNGCIKEMNPVAEKLTGWSTKEAMGLPFDMIFKIINSETHAICVSPVTRVLETSEVMKLPENTMLVDRYNHLTPVEDSAAPIVSMSGEKLGVVMVFRDCSEEKEKRNRIEYLSYHDQLTKLYNRRFFEEELRRLDVPRNLPISLVMMDVNGLKLTNDAFGHNTGDDLLVSVAEVLRHEFRTDDVIARIGGDEFVVLLPKTGSEDLGTIIERVHSRASQMMLGPIGISLSIGFDIKTEVAQDVASVLNRAEDMMYHNKLTESHNMRSRTIQSIMCKLSDHSFNERERLQKVSEWAKKIGKALKLKKDELNQLGLAGLMYDIGKIAIGETVLNKKEDLTHYEQEEIKRHSEIGYHILKSVDDYMPYSESALSHH